MCSVVAVDLAAEAKKAKDTMKALRASQVRPIRQAIQCTVVRWYNAVMYTAYIIMSCTAYRTLCTVVCWPYICSLR